ncbi:MFS transporter [Pseudomonas sp. S37]|uniref:peptide MFS transporter n=1 Tax=Pseudomonas sp. S37 TaxID=2767449 RepID=UPI001911E5C1|nr:oligopeptide:H+ symporter [Pseudomonas sp. S37]MBK4993289.1 MFS transporter [Pseudomonas sp. S37]
MRPTSKHRSFTTVFLVELWERFGFYGMAALLVLFMIDKLGFEDSRANLTWGAFSALAFAAPAIGGWIGDRVLGARRTMIAGAVVLCSGYLMLALARQELPYLFAALSVIVVGNGLFKANAASLVRRIYEGDEARIDSAFTTYYLAINLGAAASMLATPWIKDHWGWSAAFAVCCAGMAIGILNFLLMYRTLAHIGSPADSQPVCWKRVAGIVVGALALCLFTALVLEHTLLATFTIWAAGLSILSIFVYMTIRAAPAERAGLLAALILTLQVFLFFIFYQQQYTSITLFALRNVDPRFTFFGHTLFTWSAAQFQALSAIWIIVLGPFLVLLYNRLASRGHDAPVAVKFTLGFAAVAASFFLLAVSGQFAVDGRVSSWFVVWSYALYALGDLLISGLGLAMISRYVPIRMSGFMMGAYLVAAGVAQYLGSAVANLAQLPPAGMQAALSLPLYMRLFNGLGWAALGGMTLALLLLPLLKRLSLAHQSNTTELEEASTTIERPAVTG